MARKSGSTKAAQDTVVKQWSRHDDKSSYLIQSVANAIDLLELVATATHGMNLEGLRRQLGFSRDTAYKLVTTLERRDYLELDRQTNHYRLAQKTLELSQTFIRQAVLFPRSRPIIRELSRLCGETVYVTVLKDDHAVYLEQVETGQAVRVVSRFGSQLPAYGSAGGKVLLAGLPTDALASYLEKTELVAYTAATICDRQRLAIHLQQVADQGYAINDEELETGVVGVAAPIHNHAGKVIAAVVISAPKLRVTAEQLHGDLVLLVREAAARISGRLGYIPAQPEKG
jgi:DNA-binding IclR family transcriptional regulator